MRKNNIVSRVFIIVILLLIFSTLVYLIYKSINEESNVNTSKKEINEKKSNQKEKVEETSEVKEKKIDENSNIPKEEQEENINENKNKSYDVKEIILNGEDNITIKLNSKYKELGAKAVNTDNEDISEKLEIHSTVDTSKKGTYKVYYSIGNWIKVRYVTVE